MKRRSGDWLPLAQALLSIRGCARDALRLIGRLELLLERGSEAAGILAAIELKAIGAAETARRALKRRAG